MSAAFYCVYRIVSSDYYLNLTKFFNIMRTLVIIVVSALTGILVTMCINTGFKYAEKEVEKAKLIKEENPNVLFKEVNDQKGRWMYRISKVEFEGHTYIVLEDHGTAILHDPDCQCQTQK